MQLWPLLLLKLVLRTEDKPLVVGLINSVQEWLKLPLGVG